MDATKIILGAVSLVIGLIMMPVVAWFIYQASHYRNDSGGWESDPNVTGIAGLTSVLNIVGYGFAFGLVGIGVGMIYMGFRQ